MTPTPNSVSRTISRREWIAVLALLLLAFTLRAVGLTRVPPGLHNDEVIETKIAETVAAGRLAIFFPEDTGSEGLHYYFAALFINVFGDTVYALRLPAVFLSLISACLTWALARRLFGPIVALAALAGFTVAFWTVAFGRIISHVIMEVPVAALAAYCFWRAWSSSGRRALALWVLSGAWLGLSIYTYTAARILPAIFVAFGVYVAIARRAEWQRWRQGIAITLAVAVVVALPIVLYLTQNPTVDDLDFFEIDRPLTELQKGNLAPAIESALNTLGMFAFVGDPLPYYDVPGRPVFEPAGALLLTAGLLIALRRWRQPEYAFVVLWLFMSLVPGMLSQPAPNYTRTIGVQIVLFAFPGIAIAAVYAPLFKSRPRLAREAQVLNRWRNPLVYSGLALLFAGNLIGTARHYFVVWPSINTVRFWHHSGLKAVADRLQSDPDNSPVAVCLPDELLDERQPWWKPGWQHMRYLLHRPDLEVLYFNCVDTMIFINGPARYAIPDAADGAALDAFPIYTQFLKSAQPTLDVLPDRLGVIVRADISTVLNQYLVGAPAESIVAYAPEAGGGSAQLPVDFAGSVEFLGHSLSSSVIRPSSSFDLTTYWRVTSDLPPQLSQFTHLLNADGQIVAQQDRLALTSASLRPGDTFAQIHRITLRGDLPPGEYALSIGLYTTPDGTRLPIVQAGRPRGDRLWLRAIDVREQP